MDLVRNGAPQGVNGELPVVSSVKTDTLEIASKG